MAHNDPRKDAVSKKPTYQRDYLRRIRNATIEALGGKCCRCGFSDKRALQVDHIYGGGSFQRKNKNYVGQFNNHVLKSFLANEGVYQLLCANCNWIKRVEEKEASGVTGDNHLTRIYD